MLLCACAAVPREGPVGLFTNLPILWRETGGVAELLASDAPPHWALTVLEQQGQVRALDSLAGQDGGAASLAGLDPLIMAQPRPLSPQENVALDNWVNGGGKVLLFADPMLTSGAAYALGDRRRPQDVVLLSPILARWGLRLEFDESQPAGQRQVMLLGVPIPVNLPGQLALTGERGGCVLLSRGLAARCRIGKGDVLAIADAALLDEARDDDLQARRTALEWLLDSLRTVGP